MLDYQGTNEEGNLREFGVNLISNSVWALTWNFLSTRNLNMKFGEKLTMKNFTNFKTTPTLLTNQRI
jgi:hypothetical protein